MHGLRWTLNVRLQYHVRTISWSVEVEQEDSLVRLSRTPNDQVEALLAKLTIEILPVVRADAIVRLELLFAVSPFAQALQVDVLHGTSALARCDKRVPILDVFLVLEADAAALARLLGTYGLMHSLRVHGLVEGASQTLGISGTAIVETEVDRVGHSTATNLASVHLSLCIAPIKAQRVELASLQ